MKGRPVAVHAIIGDKTFDSFVAEEALEEALAAAVGDERADAVEVLRGEETSWARVLDAVRTRSLFVSRRAVVVRNAEALKGDAEGLDGYLADPTPGVTLVLVAAKPDRRRTTWKRVLERAAVVKAEPPKGQALRAYVRGQVRRRKLQLADAGVEEVLDRVGQDLRRLVGELDKLEAYAGGSSEALTAEDVAAVLGRGLAQPLYRLGDALVERRTADVLELAESLLEEGEDALRLLGAVHRSLRQLRAAVSLRGSRVSREEVAARLGLPPQMAFKAPGLLEAARAWSESQLVAALAAVGEADRRIKTGSNPRVALAAAIVAACGGAGPRTSSRPARPPAE
ncbi:MAG: DNA polymerase III subunit delta [Acidobacteria bacterium]|nr:DNA polymerase III subunit delta [Acidobacteriota bacterium]